MLRKRDLIVDISPTKENWNIVARVLRLWVMTDFDKHKAPLSVEMVLVDDTIFLGFYVNVLYNLFSSFMFNFFPGC